MIVVEHEDQNRRSSWGGDDLPQRTNGLDHAQGGQHPSGHSPIIAVTKVVGRPLVQKGQCDTEDDEPNDDGWGAEIHIKL